jgi:hypothetical protein
MNVSVLLLMFALVLFGVAAARVELPRLHFGWLGAAVATLSLLLSGAGLS